MNDDWSSSQCTHKTMQLQMTETQAQLDSKYSMVHRAGLIVMQLGAPHQPQFFDLRFQWSTVLGQKLNGPSIKSITCVLDVFDQLMRTVYVISFSFYSTSWVKVKLPFIVERIFFLVDQKSSRLKFSPSLLRFSPKQRDQIELNL